MPATKSQLAGKNAATGPYSVDAARRSCVGARKKSSARNNTLRSSAALHAPNTAPHRRFNMPSRSTLRLVSMSRVSRRRTNWPAPNTRTKPTTRATCSPRPSSPPAASPTGRINSTARTMLRTVPARPIICRTAPVAKPRISPSNKPAAIRMSRRAEDMGIRGIDAADRGQTWRIRRRAPCFSGCRRPFTRMYFGCAPIGGSIASRRGPRPAKRG